MFGDIYDSSFVLVHKQSTADIVFNYIFLVICLVLLTLSTICNPVVFWFHRKMKQNTSAILFQILTTNDFLTCCVTLPFVMWGLLHESETGEEKSEEAWQILYTVLRNTLFRWSLVIAAVLGVVRSTKILRPFARIRQVHVLVALAGGGVLTVVTNLLCVLGEPSAWNPYIQQVLYIDFRITSPYFMAYLVLYLANVGTALGTALASMYGLAQNSKERKRAGISSEASCTACRTVMMINFLISVQFLFTMTSWLVTWACPNNLVLINYTAFLRFPLCNCVMSALNPVIIIVRSGILKQQLVERRNKWKSGVSDALSTTTATTTGTTARTTTTITAGTITGTTTATTQGTTTATTE